MGAPIYGIPENSIPQMKELILGAGISVVCEELPASEPDRGRIILHCNLGEERVTVNVLFEGDLAHSLVGEGNQLLTFSYKKKSRALREKIKGLLHSIGLCPV